MELIKVVVERNIVRIDEKPEIITSGTVGLPVEFSFDSDWDGLTKIAAYVAGDVKKLVKIEAENTVPWEVLQRPGVWFGIGVYGMSEDGTIVIPAIYSNVSVIRAGTDLDGDREVSPTPQVLSQFVREYLEEFPPNDGVSPSVEVSDTSGGHKVSITDKDGVHTFYVMDGMNGKDGNPGPQGPTGPAGHQGETGTPGKSAYEYALEVGYTGTELDFAYKMADESSDFATVIYGYSNGIEIEEKAMSGQPFYCVWADDEPTPYFFPLIKWEGSTHTAFFGGRYGDGMITISYVDGVWNKSEESTPQNAFIGDADTTVEEYLEAHRNGKVCFMARNLGGSGLWNWMLVNVNSSRAIFHSTDSNGNILYGQLLADGNWSYETKDFSGKADASTTTTAGSYGKAVSNGSFYYPCITVNEQGIVTSASEAFVPAASTKSSGLMDSTMYSYVYGNSHFEVSYQSRNESYVGMEVELLVSNCKMKTLYANGGTRYIPSVYGVYAYNEDDNSFVNVPIIKTKGTSGGTATVYVNFDSSYLSSSGSAVFVVLYEKIYGTSGSSM